jgi:hypothetical protein
MVERVRRADIEAKVKAQGDMQANGQASKQVRGRPFQPGNPGRPPGAKNKVTRLVEQLIADEAVPLARAFIQLALAGNEGCLRDSIKTLLPRRNGRPIDFNLPAINNPADAVAATAAITNGVNDGSLTAEEAGHLVHFVEVYLKAVETHDLAARLEALESRKEKKS